MEDTILRTESIAAGLEVRPKDRLDRQLRRHPHHSIPNLRYPRWPLLPICFRYVLTSHRGRSILPCTPRSSIASIDSLSIPALHGYFSLASMLPAECHFCRSAPARFAASLPAFYERSLPDWPLSRVAPVLRCSFASLYRRGRQRFLGRKVWACRSA